MQMDTDEYEERRTQYWRKSYNEEKVKPNGMAGHWGYRLRKENEFDEIIRQYIDQLIE